MTDEYQINGETFLELLASGVVELTIDKGSITKLSIPEGDNQVKLGPGVDIEASLDSTTFPREFVNIEANDTESDFNVLWQAHAAENVAFRVNDSDFNDILEVEDKGGPVNINGAVNADQAQVTNETLVSVTQTTTQSVTAGTWETVPFDSETKDERGEFDTTNYQFTPDQTGWYLVSFNVRFAVAADQDQLETRFRNVSTGVNRGMLPIDQASGSGNTALTYTGIVELTAGDAYEVQGRNADSSDDLVTFGNQKLMIRSLFR